MKKLIIFIACSFLWQLSFSQNVIYRTNAKGESVLGSIKSLINYIQEGYPIRVGWKLDLDQDGRADLEHWADAKFISILGGQVFAQIESIYAQSPRADLPQIQIGRENMKWVAVIGTNGKLLSRFIIEDMNKVDESRKALFEELIKVSNQQVETMWAKSN